MIDFTVYDELSGEIIFTGNCSIDQYESQGIGYSKAIGLYKSDEFYWENGQFIQKPPKPGDFYEFDYYTKKWVYDTRLATYDALAKRDQLLKDGPDRINPMWWLSMTTEQQIAWEQYRQDLLDITSQPNFPHDIIWPIKPTEGA